MTKRFQLAALAHMLNPVATAAVKSFEHTDILDKNGACKVGTTHSPHAGGPRKLNVITGAIQGLQQPHASPAITFNSENPAGTSTVVGMFKGWTAGTLHVS